jgi:hypothetical protein
MTAKMWRRCAQDGDEWHVRDREAVAAHSARHHGEGFDWIEIDPPAGRTETPGETEEEITEESAAWPAAPGAAAYHGLAGEIVRAIAPHTEADPVGILGSILTIFGALAAGHWFDQGSEQTPNLYTCLVGETGTGRKGTAQHAARTVFNRALTPKGWQDILLVGLESGQALARVMCDRYAEGTGDQRALVWEAELARLFSTMGREGSTVSTTLRDAWDGMPIGRAVVARKDSTIAYVHHIGMLAGITDMELRARLTKIETANGFGNRIIWLAVRRPQMVPFPQPIGDLISDDLAQRLQLAVEGAKRGGSHVWDREAARLWETFYRSQPPRMGLHGSLIARAEAQVVRLALVYGLLDGCGREIGSEHLAAAIALWEYAVRSVSYVFGEGGTGEPNADSLLKMLRRPGSRITWEEAKRSLSINGTALDSAVMMLSRLGAVQVVEVASARGGRRRRDLVRK